MSPQIQIYAPVKGPEGYSILARDLIINLSKKGYHVCLEEFSNWGPYWAELTPEEHFYLGQALSNRPFMSRDAMPCLSICLPEQARKVEQCKNFVYTMFETNGLYQPWVQDLTLVDEVIVPTSYNQETFSRAGVPVEKISIAPIGYNPERYNPEVEPLALKTEGRPLESFEHRFLMVCEITNRKNFWGSLHLFCMAADRIGRDNVCLILKVGNYTKPMPLKHDINGFLNRLYTDKDIAAPPSEYNIFNYQPIIPNTAHASFLRLGTYYLTTSLGEGWDLTAMQCAACGLNLFIPHHSAYACWAPVEGVTFFPIAMKIPAYQDPVVARFYNGQDWFAFDMDRSKDILIDEILYDQPGLKRKREFLQNRIRGTLAWDNLLPTYETILGLGL